MKLTPNRRMAVYLKSIYPTADVLSIGEWLERLYDELQRENPRLPYRLTVHEEAAIWEDIIGESSLGRNLLNRTGTARLARDAWILSTQWKLSRPLPTQETEDTLAYSEWVEVYEQRCLEKHWVDSATFVDRIIDLVAEPIIPFPSFLTLVGFLELTPQLEILLTEIKALGVSVEFTTLVREPGNLSCVLVKDKADEFRMAAKMAKVWQGKRSDAVIGIVVPELERDRQTVVRVMEEEFLPESFNIAAPLPLVRYPLIENALLGLTLMKGYHPLEKWSRFLRSPFWGELQAEQMGRAALDVLIRKDAEEVLAVEDVIRHCEAMEPLHSKIVTLSGVKRLGQLLALKSKAEGKQLARQWSLYFQEMLGMIGWPGERVLTEEETQIKRQWDRLLKDYESMESVLEAHQYGEAVLQLNRLAGTISFSPEKSPANIQVLGLLEAIGIPFDFLWVTGLNRETWPKEPSPNPFIPLALQRDKGVSRSGAERELQMAKKYTEYLCRGAAQVIFSVPSILETGEGHISPLLADVPEVTVDDLGLSGAYSYIETWGRILAVNYDQQERAPKVSEAEKTLGGTHLLKLQSLCPFRAFAEGRLQALPLPTASFGLTASERGEVVHKVLEYFWQDIDNLTELLAVSDLDQKLKNVIGRVIGSLEKCHVNTLTPDYWDLERQRIFWLVSRLLEHEKERPYFEVVSREKNSVVELKGLKIKIRIDRVDRLASQDEILIDYKTGETNVGDWFGARPRDPQLPFYCVTREPKPVGIAFAVVRPETVAFKGVAKDKEVLVGLKSLEQTKHVGSEEHWGEQCEVWGKTLETLAENFREGVAAVEPLEGEKTCRLCSLKPLCRIHTYTSSY